VTFKLQPIHKEHIVCSETLMRIQYQFDKHGHRSVNAHRSDEVQEKGALIFALENLHRLLNIWAGM
jgi:hypothetical protein